MFQLIEKNRCGFNFDFFSEEQIFFIYIIPYEKEDEILLK